MNGVREQGRGGVSFKRNVLFREEEEDFDAQMVGLNVCCIRGQRRRIDSRSMVRLKVPGCPDSHG